MKFGFKIVIIFTFLLVYAFCIYKTTNTHVVPISHYRRAMDELSAVTSKSSDKLEDNSGTYQTYRASATKDYLSNQSAEHVISYYSGMFSNLGWAAHRLSLSETYFCKEEMQLNLNVLSVAPTRYSIGFLIDGDRSNDNARLCKLAE